MQTLEIVLFVGAVIGVIALGIWKAKKDEQGSGSSKGGEASDYFLAGRGLTWWLVGFSLIAANISTEQFVGMSGSAANWLGMAIASYEWMAAVTLVGVAFFFLPRFLKTGLYTIPEFLQYRFDGVARLAMAIPAIITLVLVATSSVIFSGAKFVSEYYNDVPFISNLTTMCWMIAILAAVYVFVGGLKACAWTDLIWGAALILGGAIVMWFSFSVLANKPAEELITTKVENSTATVADLEEAGAWKRFMLLNDGKNREAVAVTGDNLAGGKIHMVRPKTDSDIPWTALLVGLWIPNFFYWGLNQYIVQRTLGSKSLAEGQKGIVFAAGLKLIVPFIVVIPGILAFNLFSDDLRASADKKNQVAISEVASTSGNYFEVEESFAKLDPEETAKAFAVNATLAGREVTTPQGTTPAEVASEVNELAADLGKQKAEGDKAILASKKLTGYDYDAAFPVLVRNLIKPMPWISWFVLAALCGAVISSLASMLNSASTIATMDLYSNFSGKSDPQHLVKVGRIFVLIFVVIAALVAPALDNFSSIFSYIQEFQGFISPGILSVFILGFFSPKTPRFFGVVGIVTNIVAYGSLKWFLGDMITGAGLWYSDEMAFLDRMALCFFLVLIVGLVLTKIKPLTTPVVMPENKEMVLESSPVAKVWGIIIVVATVALYAIFW